MLNAIKKQKPTERKITISKKGAFKMPEKRHEADSIIVQNIDLNCDFYDEAEDYNHKDYFQVKWDGKPHRVAPGEVRKFPRYIAVHFIKHLINHILDKMDPKGNKKLMQNKKLRAEIEKKIWVGVDSYVLEQEDPEVKTVHEVEKEQIPKEEELAPPPPPPITSPKPVAPPEPPAPQPQPVSPPTPAPEPQPTQKKKKEFSLQELRKECDTLDLPYQESDPKETLQKKVNEQYG